MRIDALTLHDRDRALATEWLLADGAGGYASSTALLCGTRRYHGLWVPALKPPVDRRVALAHMEEKLRAGGSETFLSTAEYDAGFFPDGSPHTLSFSLDPLPRLVSRVGNVEVEREVLLLRDGAGVCLTYRVRAEGAWALDLAPFVAMRSMHALLYRHEGLHVEPLAADSGWRCLAEGMPSMFLWATLATGWADLARVTVPTWYYGVLRREERARGFDHFEDLLMPGRWTVSGSGNAEWHLFASFDPPRRIDMASERAAEVARQQDLAVRAGSPKDPRLARLAAAADAFVVRRRTGIQDLATIIAGYHWFGDWGRDSLISLPGLLLDTGRLDVAEKVLRAFAAEVRDGLVPNCFAEDSGRPQYNTVDASLWFLQAVAAYARAGGNGEFLKEALWPAAVQIIRHYREGTQFGIRTDSDGLITAGSADTQLTWMDATSAGRPVTPRFGKAVETSALWISGLSLMRDLAAKLKVDPPASADEIDRARRSFSSLFWNPDRGCLFDCVFPDGRRDPAIRPNQILAVGLPHPALAGDQARAVLRTVQERLLTPRGLRTLSPDDPLYRGRYEGGPDERDAAYHQGTVWPWLLGPYVDALMAVEDPLCARGQASQLLAGLLDSTEQAGLGHVSEIFDGDPPHTPRGCIAQAWSLAAAIHIWKRLEETGGVPA
jgi:predicted glycogen debranching enzyme